MKLGMKATLKETVKSPIHYLLMLGHNKRFEHVSLDAGMPRSKIRPSESPNCNASRAAGPLIAAWMMYRSGATIAFSS